MKIGIVGWGVEGQSAYNYFGPEHSYLIVSEEPRDDFPAESEKIKVRHLKGEKPVGITSQAEDLSYLDGIDKCDKVIYSVTSYKNLRKQFGHDPKFWNKAVTVQHIFFEEVKTRNIIGVTGSKGKGTTSTLIYELLKSAGKMVWLGGNIGTSVLDFVRQVGPDDWVVLELSNFQLHEFPHSPHIGVVLMIVPEHLDWHANLEEYIAAKSNLFNHQKPDDIAIYFAGSDLSRRIAAGSRGIKIPYFAAPGARLRKDGMIVINEPEVEVIHRSEVKLLGEHNLQNVCAALTAMNEAIGNLDGVKTVLASFSGLEHRLELVRELGGVKYYDDSFGTNPDTAVVALKAFRQPKVLILGGIDKGLPFDELIDEIAASDVRHVILIGRTTDKLQKMLADKGYGSVTAGLRTMPKIVAKARELAQPGDVVLLSTAASSFDLFKDYKDRGNQFKQAVAALS